MIAFNKVVQWDCRIKWHLHCKNPCKYDRRLQMNPLPILVNSYHWIRTLTSYHDTILVVVIHLPFSPYKMFWHLAKCNPIQMENRLKWWTKGNKHWKYLPIKPFPNAIPVSIQKQICLDARKSPIYLIKFRTYLIFVFFAKQIWYWLQLMVSIGTITAGRIFE